MNEEQIKAIAMEVAKSMHEGFLWKEGCGWESGIIPSEVREFATRFLTRIDAERGKEAVAWALFAENGNIRIWSSAPEEVKKLAEEQGMTLLPLYLSPVTPAGCTRSHPHESMDAACEVKTVEARKNFLQEQGSNTVPQPVIPAGWTLVPIEPTEAMLKAGAKSLGALHGHHGAEDAYRAMLAAAKETK